jgi:hypothetical protein
LRGRHRVGSPVALRLFAGGDNEMSQVADAHEKYSGVKLGSRPGRRGSLVPNYTSQDQINGYLGELKVPERGHQQKGYDNRFLART